MKTTPIIACSIFRPALEALGDSIPSHPVYFFDSRLHFTPERLYNEVVRITQELKVKQVFLLYGECSAGFNLPIPGINILRVNRKDCLEFLLGPEQTKSFARQRCFVMLPEWVIRWEELFYHWFGFSPDLLKTYMQEIYSSIIIVDDHSTSLPDATLKDIAQATGLDCQRYPVDITLFRDAILPILTELE